MQGGEVFLSGEKEEGHYDAILHVLRKQDNQRRQKERNGMVMQPEAALSRKIVEKVTKEFSENLIELRKAHGTPMGKTKLDIEGSIMGHKIEIEVKMPGKLPTELQKKRIRDLTKLNVITGCVTSVEEAIQLIRNQAKEKGVIK